ncbi:MAG: endonuclease/exonuclease/phosphatase family protein [Roseibium sp.]
MFRLLSLIGWCGSLGALFVCGLGLSAFMVPDFWLTDNMSFFLRQFMAAGLAGCIGGAIGFLTSHRFRWLYNLVWVSAVIALLSLTSLTVVRTFENTVELTEQVAAERTLKVVSINIEYLFLGDQVLQEYLKQVDADVIVFQETLWWLQIRHWKHRGEPVGGAGLGGFPEHLHVGKLGSLVVYSKLPLLDAVSETIEGTRPDGASVYYDENRELLSLKLDTGSEPLNLVVIHPDSPRNERRWNNKRSYFNSVDTLITELREEANGPILAIGDWNSAPWSERFQRTLSSNNLSTAYADGWPQTTRFFFDYRLHWILGAPVDQFAITDDIQVKSVSLGPHVGSDHLPLEVELLLP